MEIKQEIFEKAKIVYKEELSTSEASALNEMCAAAYSQLLSRLKDGISVDTIHDEFIRAAGMLGIALFIGLDCPPFDSFSAGNLTLKKRGDASAKDTAASLQNQAELMLAGYLRDDGFYFGTVRY